MGLAVVRHGGVGRKQKAIIRRESTMAAGQAGKVPGAPPRNPTDARSRETRRRKKSRKNALNYTNVSLWRPRAELCFAIRACGLLLL